MAPSELLCCSQSVAFAAVLEKGGILGMTYKIAVRACQEALGPGAGMGGSFPGSRSQLGSHKRRGENKVNRGLHWKQNRVQRECGVRLAQCTHRANLYPTVFVPANHFLSQSNGSLFGLLSDTVTHEKDLANVRHTLVPLM